MKEKILFAATVIIMLCIGCQNDDSEESNKITLSQSSFQNITNNDTTLTVNIKCAKRWSVISDKSWCEIDNSYGTGDKTIRLIIYPNGESTTRNATLTVKSADKEEKITISQKGTDYSTYTYNLKVIFHVFYKDKTNPVQYITQERLRTILNNVNALYKSTEHFNDINLNFTLATTDLEGNELDTPGVEYKHWDEEYPIDCEKFMNDDTREKDSKNYVSLLWDPNFYVNIMVYNFKSDDDNFATLGISHLPLNGTEKLAGLGDNGYSYIRFEELPYPACVSLNSLYAGKEYESTNRLYSPSDPNVTLAHELGHYLGLYHVFSESETSSCEDTDFCKDTKSYNKEEYDANVEHLYSTMGNKITFEDLVKRTNCEDELFLSHNIMDYAVSYSDEITAEQAARMRHVLTNSPLIPGPKKNVRTFRSSRQGKMDIHFKVVK